MRKGAREPWIRRVLPWLGLASLVGLAQLPLHGARACSRSLGVIDLHVDLSYQLNYKHHPLENGSGQYLSSRLLDSGVYGVVLPLFVPHDVAPEGRRMADFESSYQAMLTALQQTPPYCLPGCESPGKVRTWFSFEGAEPFAKAPGEVGRWIERGAVLWGLVHTEDNALATSAGKGPRPRSPAAGLTPEGKQVAAAVLQHGGVLDVSHASDEAAWELVRLAQAAGRPIVASHSNARALAPHPRNLPDDLALAIAKTGGVVGVNFHTPFLTTAATAQIDDVVRHIRHWARLLGVEHIAIGSDFEGGIRPAQGLNDVRGFPALARALEQAGFSETQVAQIFGLNALRVLCGNGQRVKAPQCQ